MAEPTDKKGSADPGSDAVPIRKPPRAPRVVRLLFYLVWVLIVPLTLAILTVRLLAPDEPFTGGIRGFVRDQQVPVVIVLLTGYAWAVWRFRYLLPLASAVGVMARSDLPAKLRGRYEDAAALVDEARRILRSRAKRVERELTRAQRDELAEVLEALEHSMVQVPLDEDDFEAKLARAEKLVAARLGRWRKGEIREYAESIGVAVGVALILRVFVIEAFKIPSGSMIPTLMKGDHIFVAKYVYGPLLPWTDVRLYNRLPPERADIMVFKVTPSLVGSPEEQDYIKRVIALPGDELEVIDGRPILNGWLAPHCYVGHIEQDKDVNGQLYVEFMGDESYLTMFTYRTNRGCSRDAECEGARQCLGGLCRETVGCRSDADCDHDQACSSDSTDSKLRFCRSVCEGSCSGGEVCVPRPGRLCGGSGVPCTADAQCGDDKCAQATRQICLPGDEVSEASCESDADCIAGKQCRAGVCGDLQGPYHVKPGEAWVMGDNRDQSHDSRAWHDHRGAGVPFEFIKGRAMFVWLSPSLDRLFYNVMGDPRLPKDTPGVLEDRLKACMAKRPPESETTPPTGHD